MNETPQRATARNPLLADDPVDTLDRLAALVRFAWLEREHDRDSEVELLSDGEAVLASLIVATIDQVREQLEAQAVRAA